MGLLPRDGQGIHRVRLDEAVIRSGGGASPSCLLVRISKYVDQAPSNCFCWMLIGFPLTIDNNIEMLLRWRPSNYWNIECLAVPSEIYLVKHAILSDFERFWATFGGICGIFEHFQPNLWGKINWNSMKREVCQQHMGTGPDAPLTIDNILDIWRPSNYCINMFNIYIRRSLAGP